MKKSTIRFSVLALACAAAHAQADLGVTHAAQKAISSSPEVAAKFNAFRASADEVGSASAGFLPRIDVTADLGRTEDRITSRNPADQGLNRGGVALNVTQMLWDGMATGNEVARLSHNKMARYFEFLDATEQTALEALRAHHDVLRYRRLVSLAEDNYVQHKYAYDQIQSRVRAGVARGVDQEQSGARLALAESNLVTEKANLHDVTERYRRIVGEPPEAMATAAMPMKRPLPDSAAAAIEGAARFSPVVAGAVEGLRAVRAQGEVRKSAFLPKVEARLRAGGGHNFDGVGDQKRDVSAQLALTWNLFNGGADEARQRQQVHLLNQATDLRDKACRDTRQTVAIAYNDVRKLEEQLVYLDRNVTSIERARDAYRQQFDIGQRSLLDLLNAENEVYTARRAQALAVADRDIAVGRTHASIGTLVAALGLTRPDTTGLSVESDGWEAGRDAASRCPLSPTDPSGSSRADLDAKARAMAVPTAALLPVTPASAAPVAAPAAPKSLAPTAAAEQRLRDWAAAWSAKDFTRYQAFYSPTFSPTQVDRSQWLADRQRRVTKPGEIRVEVLNVEATALSATQVETRFEQAYQSANYTDRSAKTLTWELAGGTWQIVRESNR